MKIPGAHWLMREQIFRKIHKLIFYNRREQNHVHGRGTHTYRLTDGHAESNISPSPKTLFVGEGGEDNYFFHHEFVSWHDRFCSFDIGIQVLAHDLCQQICGEHGILSDFYSVLSCSPPRMLFCNKPRTFASFLKHSLTINDPALPLSWIKIIRSH